MSPPLGTQGQLPLNCCECRNFPGCSRKSRDEAICSIGVFRSQIRKLADHYHATNPRVFGSVLHGSDTKASDLDLLVDPRPETTLFDLGGLKGELEDLLGVPVDVRTPAGLPHKFRARVVAEAKPV